MPDYIIRRMTREELPQVLSWAGREGWDPGLHDATSFWGADPHGFFVGIIDGKVVASGSALCYDDHFAFCGLYMVDPAFRGQGLGLALTRARLEYVGQRNAGLDGVLNMVDRYERLGYRKAHLSTRYSMTPIQKYQEPGWLVSASSVSSAALSDYDACHFPARREQFLHPWLNQGGGRAIVLVDAGQIKGYGVVRPSQKGYRIGPLFADRAEGAEAILGALCNHARDTPVSIDVPEPNTAGLSLVQRLGMQPGFACIRMYLRGDPGLPLDRIFGITSFEAG